MTKKIEMSKTEAKAAGKINSEKFNELHTLRTMYPTFEIVIKAPSKKTTSRENYKGLTYEYMENYIIGHEGDDTRDLVLKEFAEKRLISECHSKCHRYPVIKKWFLDKYPEIANFGMAAPATEESPDTQSNKIIPMPQNNTELDKVSGIN